MSKIAYGFRYRFIRIPFLTFVPSLFSVSVKEGRQGCFPKKYSVREVEKEGGYTSMGIFDPDEVITIYSIREAVEDGALVEVFRKSWEWLFGGKPVVASSNVNGEISEDEMQGVWNRFVEWRKKTKREEGEKERMFSTAVRHMSVWVIEDAVVIMMLFPEDY